MNEFFSYCFYTLTFKQQFMPKTIIDSAKKQVKNNFPDLTIYHGQIIKYGDDFAEVEVFTSNGNFKATVFEFNI